MFCQYICFKFLVSRQCQNGLTLTGIALFKPPTLFPGFHATVYDFYITGQFEYPFGVWISRSLITGWHFFFHSSAKRKKNNRLDCCQVGPCTGPLGLRGNLWMPRKNRKHVLDYHVRQVKTGMDQSADVWHNSASLFI